MLTFSTKARTLAQLEQHATKSRVLPQLCFAVSEIESSPAAVRERVMKRFCEPLIVRSSALSEDTSAGSQAGKFLSLFNIAPKNILDAMSKVMASFADECSDNQIFVQPMLSGITMSGVMFTVDPNTGGNYFVINYDESGSTDSVTSGNGRDLQVCYVFRGHKSGDEHLDRLIEAGCELMELFKSDSIDIEFAFNQADELYLLQARPLIFPNPIATMEEQQKTLADIHSFLEREMRPKLYAKGNRTIYGIMPDWNPAEMIGTRPKPLSLSLYRRLITDGIWAYQRSNYGYKNLRSFPLMMDFCGLPYIDTRVSFNSFIPKDIDDQLADKLANYYLDTFAQHPEKHDKVEFDIIFSCYTFDLTDRIKMLTSHGFTSVEQDALSESLKQLTNNIINTTDGLWISDTKRIEHLQKLREAVMKSDMDIVSKIYWLTEDCARYGTLPFAGLARAGFIAVLLLKSLVSIGILSTQDYENYMGELNTVGSQMADDRRAMSDAAFLEKYGHLRPGTYDITSMRYDAAPEQYFGTERVNNRECREKRLFTLTLNQYAEIQSQMERQGLKGDVLALFKFIKAGIEGREYAKFVFTHSLSDSMELLSKLGAKHGFSPDEMAFADISIIDRLYSGAHDEKSVILRSIAEGREKYAKTLTLTLPPVIVEPDDIYAFSIPSGAPNYITMGEATGEVCTDCSNKELIAGKILLIPAADPGYDWIFSHPIRGFVTAFGGVNSHMAIRAEELGIPAVIGTGEKLFHQLKKAQVLHIDCANKKWEILR